MYSRFCEDVLDNWRFGDSYRFESWWLIGWDVVAYVGWGWDGSLVGDVVAPWLGCGNSLVGDVVAPWLGMW